MALLRPALSVWWIALALSCVACGKNDDGDDEGEGPDVPLSEVAKLLEIALKPVKETKKVAANGAVQTRTTYAYADQYVQERVDYREGGEKKKTSITYERTDGRPTKETTREFDDAGAAKIVGVKTYTYDDAGRVTKWSAWIGTEASVSERSIERDGEGRIVKVVVVDATGDRAEKSYDWGTKTVSTKRSQEGGTATEATARYAFFENGFDDVTPLLLLKQSEKNGEALTEVTASCTQVKEETFKFTCEQVSESNGKKTRAAKLTTALITFKSPLETVSEALDVSSEVTAFDPEGAVLVIDSSASTFNGVWKPTKDVSVQENKSLAKTTTYTTETTYDDTGANPTVSKFLENDVLVSTDSFVY